MRRSFSRVFCLFIAFLFLSTNQNLLAQLAGLVVDAKTSEPLKGANVVMSPSGIGDVTDSDGYFRLPFSSDNRTDTLIISFLGYQEYRMLAGKFKSNSIIRLFPKPFTYEDSVIVSAEIIDLPRQEIPHAKEQLTLREIEQYGSGEIGDLFKSFSSVRIEGNDLDGRTIQIRGSDADEVNVYVDGVLINNLGFNNSADLSIIPTESIEKLEVLKGSNLALLGPGAFGGVVNITTKRKFERSFGLRAKTGSFDTKYILGEINLPLSSKVYLNYFGQLNTFVPEIEYFPGERFSEKTRNSSIKSSKQNHQLNFNYFTENGQFNGKFIGYFFHYEKPSWEDSRNNYLLSLSYKGKAIGLRDFDINLNFFRSDDKLNRGPFGTASFQSDYTTNRLNLKMLKKFSLKKMEVHFLGEYFHDELDNNLTENNLNSSRGLYTANLYENRGSLGSVFSFSDRLNNKPYISWKTYVGIRGDFVSNGRRDLLSTVGFQIDIDKLDWKLSPYINYGKNVKYPTLFENAYIQDVTGLTPTDTVFRRLDPEYNNTAELGLNFLHKIPNPIFRSLEAHLAIFTSAVYNKLLERPFDTIIAYSQSGRNETKGIEASLKFDRIFRYFDFSASYTGLHIEDPLLYPYKPNRNTTFQLDFNLFRGFYLTSRYFIEGTSTAWFFDQENNIQTSQIPSFDDVDISFGYQLSIRSFDLNLQVSGYNLMDNSGYLYYYLNKRYLQAALSIKYH